MARAKKKGNFRFLNVHLPVELLDRLEEYSDTTRIPKVAITEMALQEYLDKVAPRKRKRRNVKFEKEGISN